MNEKYTVFFRDLGGSYTLAKNGNQVKGWQKPGSAP
jgi:hypothetical protein